MSGRGEVREGGVGGVETRIGRRGMSAWACVGAWMVWRVRWHGGGVWACGGQG